MPVDIDLNVALHDDESASENNETFPYDLNEPPWVDEERVEAEDDLNQPQVFPSIDEVEGTLTSEATPEATCKRRDFLTHEDRKVLWQLLQRSINNGILEKGAIRRAASLYNVHISVIYRIWYQAKETGDPCHKKARNCGRKRVTLDLQKIHEVPLSKWFYITKNSTNYYLLKDEDEPYRTCKSKKFICKIMFLAAVTRPRFDHESNISFTGKIGIFPFVTKEPAKRNSVNRVAGTMEKKPITSVTREVNKMYLIHKILPAIKNSWPIEDTRETIFIQQDNAKSHIDCNDKDFCEPASKDGFDIRLVCQPPNSPDLNILDLGFFNAIQALQQKHVMKSIDDLISAVEKAFYEYSPIQSNKIFLTLRSCMVEIMKIKGSNKYKIPHMKKDALHNQYGIPNQLECDLSLIDEVTRYLGNANA